MLHKLHHCSSNVMSVMTLVVFTVQKSKVSGILPSDRLSVEPLSPQARGSAEVVEGSKLVTVSLSPLTVDVSPGMSFSQRAALFRGDRLILQMNPINSDTTEGRSRLHLYLRRMIKSSQSKAYCSPETRRRTLYYGNPDVL